MLQPMADVTKAQWCHILKCLHQNKTVSVSSLDGLIFSYKYLATAQHCPGTKHWLEFLRHEKHFKKKTKKEKKKEQTIKKPYHLLFLPVTLYPQLRSICQLSIFKISKQITEVIQHTKETSVLLILKKDETNKSLWSSSKS